MQFLRTVLILVVAYIVSRFVIRTLIPLIIRLYSKTPKEKVNIKNNDDSDPSEFGNDGEYIDYEEIK